MFDNGDWVLDDNFLKDADEKATQFYSENNDDVDHIYVKRPRLDESITKESPKGTQKSLREQLVLDILGNTDNAASGKSEKLETFQKLDQIIFTRVEVDLDSNPSIPNTLPNASLKKLTRCNKLSPDGKIVVTRKFPGPAGLLPDSATGFSFSKILYVDDSDENESHENVENFYSQNTKKLFTEGAWRRMLNDVPSNFLKGHEISSIKSKMIRKSTMKSLYLGGILEDINFGEENPRVLLKDHTGTIEGILHRDISSKYQLDKYMVLLLYNVGVLKPSIVQKHRVLISPTNLLAIYSDKAPIVRTPQMNLLLEKIANGDTTDVLETENSSKNSNDILQVIQHARTRKEEKNDDNYTFDDDFDLPEDIDKIIPLPNTKASPKVRDEFSKELNNDDDFSITRVEHNSSIPITSTQKSDFASANTMRDKFQNFTPTPKKDTNEVNIFTFDSDDELLSQMDL